MDSLNKKILLDLCVTPGTTIPTAIGVSLLLLSVVFGGFAAFIGLLCCLAGFGALMVNFIFNLQNVSQRAARQWQKQQKAEKDRELDKLDTQLLSTRETKDEESLRNLRALYESFCGDFEAGKISSNVPPTMLAEIDDIFQSCVHRLSRSIEIWEQSQRVTGKLKKGLDKQRKALLNEVEESVEMLASVINEVTALRMETTKGEMTRIQQRLHSQLAVAKATEERVRELDGLGHDDPDKYSEYLTPQE